MFFKLHFGLVWSTSVKLSGEISIKLQTEYCSTRAVSLKYGTHPHDTCIYLIKTSFMQMHKESKRKASAHTCHNTNWSALHYNSLHKQYDFLRFQAVIARAQAVCEPTTFNNDIHFWPPRAIKSQPLPTPETTTTTNPHGKHCKLHMPCVHVGPSASYRLPSFGSCEAAVNFAWGSLWDQKFSTAIFVVCWHFCRIVLFFLSLACIYLLKLRGMSVYFISTHAQKRAHTTRTRTQTG